MQPIACETSLVLERPAPWNSLEEGRQWRHISLGSVTRTVGIPKRSDKKLDQQRVHNRPVLIRYNKKTPRTFIILGVLERILLCLPRLPRRCEASYWGEMLALLNPKIFNRGAFGTYFTGALCFFLLDSVSWLLTTCSMPYALCALTRQRTAQTA